METKKTDHRLVYLYERYIEIRTSFSHYKITWEEVEEKIKGLEEESAEIWGSKQVFYDYLETKHPKLEVKTILVTKQKAQP